MPPKKKKLKTSLNNVLAAASRIQKEKYKQQAHEAQLAKVKQKQKTHPQHGRKPNYNKLDRVLLIGEGNFSFARSLAENYMKDNPSNIVATCYDSEQVLYEKYADEAKNNLAILKELGVTVLFDIDGTKLHKYKDLRKNRYTRIIFNFPHAGSGIKDQDHNVRANQKLLNEFFTSATPLLSTEGQISRFHPIKSQQYEEEEEENDEALLEGFKDLEEEDESEEPLPEGEMHITIKTCKPYNLWDVRTLAKTTGRLAIKTTFPFHPDIYPGYEHRRTLGFKQGVSKGENAEIVQSDPKTFVVVRKSAMAADVERSKQGAINRKKELQRLALLGKKKRKQRHGGRKGDSSDDDDEDDDDE
ncbi:hypothetical protein BDA99DRAFT_554290 [Phascolomyces articulosus]|uniref:25S rRNA (uridine-N(3))-methyltransferase BMT5-like domain-containing protein n=1 Tax=Phascolomyces articulosus TaxID=60185 RepID=A0AAD5KZY8_9FUNG|nr:hypothetical protein BDA99DRAFT_554290 [Phascolomyces articulosus]